MNHGKLWYLEQPLDTPFAEAGLRSPDVNIGHILCDRCSRGAIYIMPKPLVFEWDPGSDVIGDFTWPDGTRVAVKRHVFEALASKFSGIHAEPVEMVQDPKLKRPKRPNKRTKTRVWLPYTGPELVELWPDRSVPYLPETTTEVSRQCKKCGNEPIQLSGIELKWHDYDATERKLVPARTPRTPGRGVFVSASEVGSTPIFRLPKVPGPILCTDEVRSFIEREGFTNVEFREYGDVL